MPKPQNIISKALAAIPKRLRKGHKRSYGHLLVIAGSMEYTGAAMLAAAAAMRSGCGYVTLACPQSLVPIVSPYLPEAIKLPLTETGSGSISGMASERIFKILGDVTAVAIGPGLSTHPETQSFIRELLKKIYKPMLIDADALVAFKEQPKALDGQQIVITPHLGEFERLTGVPKDDVLKIPEIITQKFALDSGSVVVLKGAPTVVTDGKRVHKNQSGNAGLSTAGTGDILTGVIGSLMAQGMDLYLASVAGTYIHGLAGDKCARDLGMTGMIASDLLLYLPKIFKRFESIQK